jgi:hypothetical protein
MINSFFDSLLGTPGLTDIIAQGLGIVGMVIMILSFQCKSNKVFFLMQAAGSIMFVLNFLLIDAYGGSFFNAAGLIRGLLLSKNGKKIWKFVTIEALFALSYVGGALLDHSTQQLILTAIPCIALVIITVFMWKGNPKHIRYAQISCSSPAWIVHNIFNFSLGGLICECFNMISSAIFLVREHRASKKQA